jgi:hypothetical protein
MPGLNQSAMSRRPRISQSKAKPIKGIRMSV